MTDNEIKEALLHCSKEGDCSRCPYKAIECYDCIGKLCTDAIGMINRLEAEVKEEKDFKRRACINSISAKMEG